MNVRAQATGMASQTQNIGNSIVQQFFPALLNSTGFYCFYMFTGVNFILAVFVWYCIPETKGVPLEEMDVLFGGVNHVAGGAELIEMGKAGGGGGDEDGPGGYADRVRSEPEARDSGIPVVASAPAGVAAAPEARRTAAAGAEPGGTVLSRA
jgi:hypothetical protein